jgi:hypothetical protein
LKTLRFEKHSKFKISDFEKKFILKNVQTNKYEHLPSQVLEITWTLQPSQETHTVPQFQLL